MILLFTVLVVVMQGTTASTYDDAHVTLETAMLAQLNRYSTQDKLVQQDNETRELMKARLQSYRKLIRRRAKKIGRWSNLINGLNEESSDRLYKSDLHHESGLAKIESRVNRIELWLEKRLHG